MTDENGQLALRAGRVVGVPLSEAFKSTETDCYGFCGVVKYTLGS